MAVGIPNLDQITTPLDEISGTFDEYTLEQLDSFGNIDSLGTLNVDVIGFQDLLKVRLVKSYT